MKPALKLVQQTTFNSAVQLKFLLFSGHPAISDGIFQVILLKYWTILNYFSSSISISVILYIHSTRIISQIFCLFTHSTHFWLHKKQLTNWFQTETDFSAAQ